MATFTRLTRRALAQLLDRYAVGALREAAPLCGGRANSSYAVTTEGGRFVLSVCDEKQPAEIGALTALLEHLAAHGVPATRLVRAADGAPFVLHAGQPAYLKRYIAGAVPAAPSAAMARQIGEALARLHQVPPLAALPAGFAYGLGAFGELDAAQPPGDFAAWLAARAAELRRVCAADLPRGLIHGDLFFDNVLFDRGQLVALLDFEEACHDALLFDVGMSICGCCCPAGRLRWDLAAALVDGYEAIRPLEALERELLQSHVVYGATATAFWRFRQYTIRHPELGAQTAFCELRDLADAVRSIPPERFARRLRGAGERFDLA